MTLTADTLPFGRVSDALHVVIDVQNLFFQPTAWQVTSIPAILPPILSLLTHAPDTAAFARFIPPASAATAPGMWRGYYRHWDSVTRDRLDPGQLDVLPDLTDVAPAAPMLDKPGYSVFSCPAFRPLLRQRGITTLILSGVETDVCVLSTVMEAVDIGLRVIIAADAVTGGSPEGHDAALSILRTRFDQQVEIASASAIISAWSAA
ncbi:cysteine hydrolase family protein [Oceaniglobus indicus]|uniref:cysteine hydrolase family protein n=1 Tax=Oceaniglobus indicus TaxID=2047749 RepID=UPI000C18B997|nr:isochorismatase family cysteine hydrolase [Oceaniglobus indicus]